MAWAQELGLGGFSKAGHPGVVILEGPLSAVDEHVRRLRSPHIKWKSMEIAGTHPNASPLTTALARSS